MNKFKAILASVLLVVAATGVFAQSDLYTNADYAPYWSQEYDYDAAQARVGGFGLSVGYYDFAALTNQTDAAATASVVRLTDMTNLYLHCTVPLNAIIWDGFVDVISTNAPATCTNTIGVVTANDLVSTNSLATAVGRHALIPVGTAATAVKVSSGTGKVYAHWSGDKPTAGRWIVYLLWFKGY